MTKKHKPLKLLEVEDEHLGMTIFEVAEYLTWIKEKKPDFLSFEAKKFGFGRRTTYYLLKVYERFETLGIDPNQLSKIGWTKLAILADYIDQANRKDLLRLAEKYTARELQGVLQGIEPVQGTRCVVFYLAPKDYETLESILVKHGAIKSGHGLVGKEPALIRALRQ